MQDKPLTPAKRESLNRVYRMRLKGTTKEAISLELSISERTARELVSIVAQKHPVISISSDRGYLLLPKKDSLNAEQLAHYRALCGHAKAENISRAREILKRNSPLERWERGS